MTEVLTFLLIGLGSGAMLALPAMGVVLVYRGSGVLNFASSAMGTLAVFVYFDLHTRAGWSFGPAAVVGVLTAAASGVLTHYLVMRPMRRSSALARVTATLAVLIVVQSALQLHYGSVANFTPSALPRSTVDVGGVLIGVDKMILFAIAVIATATLHYVYTRTRFGFATTAVAEDVDAASALGIASDRIAALNWGLGAALSGIAGILLAPIIGVQLLTQTQLIVPVLAAALVGRMASFPLTLLGGMAVGVGQAEVSRYIATPGWSQAVPFLFILAVMILRRQELPSRSKIRESLPSIGSGRISPAAFGGTVVAMLLLVWAVLPSSYVNALSLTFAVCVVLLSSVVVTGYAGQLSLCQFSMAGVGAVIAGRLVAQAGLPFELALIAAVAALFPIGMLIGLPALRARGISLAVTTLALAYVLENVLFQNPSYTGGLTLTISPPTFLGFSVDTFAHPREYTTLCLALFVLAAIVTVNLRRGRAGRRLIAVRTNERAAAAVGVNVYAAKLYAFALAASLAALGGALLMFRNTSFVFADAGFDPFSSITGLIYVTLGGIGYVLGPVAGSIGQPGGLLPTVFLSTSPTFGIWLALAGGVLTIRFLQVAPSGIVPLKAGVLRLVGERARPSRRRVSTAAGIVDREASSTVERVEPLSLRAEHVRVAYGGVVAVDDVGLELAPGQIVGLIGPNGAGKTTLIDALTGFVRPQSGTIELGGDRVDAWPVHRRVRRGLARSFQSLELFEDMTVAENLLAAADRQSLTAYATDLLWPRKTPLPGNAVAAVREFGLEEDLDARPDLLPYGRRRLVGIARTVTARPSVLLLDEPAAGLWTAETDELGRLLRRLADDWGMAILLVEHDVDLVMRVCDRVIVMNFGKKIAEGAPAEVRRDPAVIAAYLGTADAPGAGTEQEEVGAR